MPKHLRFLSTTVASYGDPEDEDFEPARPILINLTGVETVYPTKDGSAIILLHRGGQWPVDEDYDDLVTTLAIEGLVIRTPPRLPGLRKGTADLGFNEASLPEKEEDNG